MQPTAMGAWPTRDFTWLWFTGPTTSLLRNVEIGHGRIYPLGTCPDTCLCVPSRFTDRRGGITLNLLRLSRRLCDDSHCKWVGVGLHRNLQRSESCGLPAQ